MRGVGQQWFTSSPTIDLDLPKCSFCQVRVHIWLLGERVRFGPVDARSSWLFYISPLNFTTRELLKTQPSILSYPGASEERAVRKSKRGHHQNAVVILCYICQSDDEQLPLIILAGEHCRVEGHEQLFPNVESSQPKACESESRHIWVVCKDLQYKEQSLWREKW
jgi:hypothetical protein